VPARRRDARHVLSYPGLTSYSFLKQENRSTEKPAVLWRNNNLAPLMEVADYLMERTMTDKGRDIAAIPMPCSKWFEPTRVKSPLRGRPGLSLTDK